MHNRISKVPIAILCALALCMATVALGQSLAGSGALNGTVRDASGAIIPGADVHVINKSLGIDRSIKATSQGLFSAPSLPPDPGYSVVVTVTGFSVSKIEGITIHVGEQVNIPVSLSVSATQTVEVSSNTQPIMDLTKTEVSTLINQDQINSLPINGRRADEFALLSPSVVQDSTSGALSFHGVPAGNLFLLDGIDITYQWSVADSGSSTVLSNISQDAVQEFRTELIGYSAEFGRGAGGVVNILTKSGTNQFHGGAFWFFRNRTLNATDLFSTHIVNGVSAPFNPPEYRHEFGGTVGGPIIKNKLFFFSSYEGTIRNFPVSNNVFADSTYFNYTTGQLLPGVCNATAAQCAAVQAFINHVTVPSVVSRSLNQNAGFARLDYRPNEKSDWSASFDLVNFSAPHDGVTAAAVTDGSGAAGNNYNVRNHIRIAHLGNDYVISNSLVNQARFGFAADRNFNNPAPDLAPSDNVNSALSIAGMGNFGTLSSLLPNVIPTEARFDLSDNLSQVKGAHQLKYGFDLAYLRSIENGVTGNAGTFTYTNFTNFAYDLDPNPATDPVSTASPYSSEGKHYSSFAQSLGHPITRITIRDYDFFVQDQWQATKTLSINAGLRYEYASYTQPSPPSYAAVDPNVGPIHQPPTNFAPRLGFAQSLNGGKTVVRGSYGIFFNRLPGATITRLQELGGVVRKSFTLANTNAAQFATALTFPNVFTSLAQVNALVSPSSVNSGFAKPGLATPYVQEWNLGVEQQVTRNMSFNVGYIGTRGIKFIQRSDLNAGQPTGIDAYSIVNTAGQTVGSYSTPVYFNSANGNTTQNTNFARILQIDNGGHLWYDALIAEVHERDGKYLQTSLAYTYSHAEDLTQGLASDNTYFSDQGNTYFSGASTINGRNGYSYEKGRSLEDQRHRLVITAIGRTPDVKSDSLLAKEAFNGWELAPIFTYATPQHVDSTLTVSTPDPRLYYTTPTLSGIGSEAEGGTRVPFLPTANLPLGHTVQLDGRLTKYFPMRHGQSIQLSFEAINALNHIRYTGVNQLAYKSVWNSTTETGTLTQQPVGGKAGYGAGTASGGFPDGTNARRAQAVFRYTF